MDIILDIQLNIYSNYTVRIAIPKFEKNLCIQDTYSKKKKQIKTKAISIL